MSDDRPPKIAEKVKFWEEQDKINQALIPRVLEMNEAVGNLAKQAGNVSNLIATAEARATQQLQKTSETLTAYIKSVSDRSENRFSDLDQRQNSLDQQLSEQVRIFSVQITNLETRTAQELKRTAESHTSQMQAFSSSFEERLSKINQLQNSLNERLVELKKWELFLASYRKMGNVL